MPHKQRLADRLGPGQPWPMGAHWDGEGVNFAVCSAHAQAIELCLFDAEGSQELARLPLPGRDGDIWHGRLEGAGPGLVYGLRARGPWQPGQGHWFNPNKLLLDPWAREIVGRFAWRPEHFAADRTRRQLPDARDNAAHALKARVVDERPGSFDWGDDHPPCTPLADTVFYELHVKGFSRLNPGVPEALRGTCAGLAHPASISHLQGLGVTAVELLPVQYALDEERLVKLGLVNYWGYNTLGWFCPDPRLISGAGGLSPRDEFRQMVRSLHAAGLEVILDVVYNHSAETDEHGPSISLRGLDNATYYRLHHDAERRAHHENHSGCGNTLDIRQPRVLQLVMDSLRYWVSEMHVDGFRFDLAPVLGRDLHGFHERASFFQAVAQDPVLSRVKMIAEPWDLGPDGYRLGGFPRGWAEWNDRFRDGMRGFWLHMGQGGAGATRAELAQRLCASSDRFQQRSRLPAESVNFVTAHDGFTLRDLVSYQHRHNEANGEHNRDGHGHNLSFHCGVEGPSEDPTVLALRGRLQRALLACTLLAQGTPLLAAGDELGHSQQGNNNPYCQDNTTTWIDWAQADPVLIGYTARLLRLRRERRPLARHWYTGQPGADGRADLAWLRSDATPLADGHWHDPASRVLGCLINEPGRPGGPLLLLVNGDAAARAFTLPDGRWQVLLDSSEPDGLGAWAGAAPLAGGHALPLPAHAVCLLAGLQTAAR